MKEEESHRVCVCDWTRCKRSVFLEFFFSKNNNLLFIIFLHQKQTRYEIFTFPLFNPSFLSSTCFFHLHKTHRHLGGRLYKLDPLHPHCSLSVREHLPGPDLITGKVGLTLTLHCCPPTWEDGAESDPHSLICTGWKGNLCVCVCGPRFFVFWRYNTWTLVWQLIINFLCCSELFLAKHFAGSW